MNSVTKKATPNETTDKKEEIDFFSKRFEIFKQEREKEIAKEKDRYRNILGYQKVKKL